MFLTLLAHPQEVPHKRHLVSCVRRMSVGCGTVAVSLMRVQKNINLICSD
jgi:hypothetical protein